MKALDSVKPQRGWWITERGRLDLQTCKQCLCNPRLAGLLIECPECGTIYGTLREGWGDGHGFDKRP
jgi:hypothetical protein